MAVDLKSSKWDVQSFLKWFCTLGIPLLILLIPVNETFTGHIKLFLAITVAAIMTFAFENVDPDLGSDLIARALYHLQAGAVFRGALALDAEYPLDGPRRLFIGRYAE